MSWDQQFDDPIVLPGRKPLVTLQDAGTFITKLPKAEHEAAEWQAAAQALILVATSGGPTMLARIGMMRALHRHEPRSPPAKVTPLSSAEIRRRLEMATRWV